MTDVILETRNLKKSFGKLEVLKGISTGIRGGSYFLYIYRFWDPLG